MIPVSPTLEERESRPSSEVWRQVSIALLSALAAGVGAFLLFAKDSVSRAEAAEIARAQPAPAALVETLARIERKLDRDAESSQKTRENLARLTERVDLLLDAQGLRPRR